MACVYVLLSQKTKRFYIGSSRQDTAEGRLRAHNAGRTRSTKYGRPWVIIHQELLQTYTEARKRENFLKSGQGRKFLKERWRSGPTRRF